MIEGDKDTLVFTSEGDRAKVNGIQELDQLSRDFHWSAISFPAAMSSALLGEGLTIDLTAVAPSVDFAQTYRETCNPAMEDFSPCWIYEKYTSGQAGLSGSIQLQMTQDKMTGGYKVIWSGVTDRFGAPPQSYSHETDANLSATVVK